MSNYPETNKDLEPKAVSGQVRVNVHIAAEKPWVTYVMVALCVVVFAAQQISLSLTGVDLPLALGAKSNPLIAAGQFWRLFTPMLLHGSLLHIGFNMYALVIIGRGLEQHYGHMRFLLLYLVGGFAGNVVSFYLSPNPSVGASTAIFGMISAEAVFIFQNRQLFGNRARNMLMSIGMVLLVNLGLGLTPGSMIDNWGHLGGLLGGLAFSWAAGPIYEVIGLAPELTLRDKRSRMAAWQVAAAIAVVLTALVVLRLLTP